MEMQTVVDDLNFAIGINRRLLSLLGVWPLRRNASKSEAKARFLRITFTFWIIFAYVIPQYLSIVLIEREIDEYLQLVAPHVFAVLCLTKFGLMVFNADEIRQCINCIEDDWNNVKFEQDRDIMYRNAKIGRYLTILCIGCMQGSVVSLIVVMPLVQESSETIRGNVTVIERPLAWPTNYVFFDEQLTPIYEITRVIHVIGGAYLTALNCGGYTLVAILVAHACGQLQVIGSQLDRLFDDRSEKNVLNVREKIASIVEHHLRVIRYTERVNKSFRVSFLTEELGAIILICFAGYSLVTGWNQRTPTLLLTIYLMLLLGNIINFFAMSFVGQQLMDKSEEVGLAAARVKWYRLPPNISRYLILCMTRSVQPLRLSACNMVNLSLSNFGEVLRGAFVFLNMVRKVTNLE